MIVATSTQLTQIGAALGAVGAAFIAAGALVPPKPAERGQSQARAKGPR